MSHNFRESSMLFIAIDQDITMKECVGIEPRMKIFLALFLIADSNDYGKAYADFYLRNVGAECLSLLDLQIRVDYPKGEKKRIKAGGKFWHRTFCLLEKMDQMNQNPMINNQRKTSSDLFMRMILEYEFLVPGMTYSSQLKKPNKTEWYRSSRSKNTLLRSHEVVYEQPTTRACLMAASDFAEKDREFQQKYWIPMIEANSKYLGLQFQPNASKEPGKKPHSLDMLIDGKKVKPGCKKGKE